MEVTAPLSGEHVNEAIDIYKALLRFDTTNPPGNEKPLVDWIAALLESEGISSTILEAVPGRANLIARLKGGSEPGLLLTGHADVVGVEREHWTSDPFAAEERDGWIYGRGAVDMKHHVAMALTAFINLKRRNAKLNRDVVLAIVADEECGSRLGMRWLVKKHGDLLQAGYGLNEFGGFNIYLPGGRQAYLVQTSERGFCWFKLKAKGVPGHGSLPPVDSVVAKLTAAVQRLCNSPLPYHLTPEGKRYLNALGKAMGPAGVVTHLLKSKFTENTALGLFPDKEQANAVLATLHNTAIPTVLRAGEKTNVLPGSAEAWIDGRYLPGFSQDDFLTEVRQATGDAFEIEVMEGGPPSSVTIDTPLYRLIEQVIAERADGAATIPWMLTGFSDTKWLEPLGIKTYGFSPLQFPPDVQFSRLPHGHDERAPRAGFVWGVETLWQTVSRFVSR